MDAMLRAKSRSGSKEMRARLGAARQLRASASALLEFVHGDAPLSGLLNFAHARPERALFVVGGPTATFTRRQVRTAQREVRRGVAALILRDGPGNLWKLPPSSQARFVCSQGDLLGYGPQLVVVRPEHVALTLAAAAILVDALPWLRFCPLCGKLFFKVSRQSGCTPSHVDTMRARRRPRKHAEERRGRPQQDFSGWAVAQYTAWLRL
jgi:hypothetical protein